MKHRVLDRLRYERYKRAEDTYKLLSRVKSRLRYGRKRLSMEHSHTVKCRVQDRLRHERNRKVGRLTVY
jgi:hypothetical protein